MFLKKRKSLLTLLAALFAAVLLCVGAALLSTESRKAYAAASQARIYWEIDGTTLTISGNPSDVSDTTKCFDYNREFSITEIPWSSGSPTVTKVVIRNGVAPVSTANWFNEFRNLMSIDLWGLDTSKTTNMNNMFNGCNSLTELDLSGFKTSNVTNMLSMFNGCTVLTELDLSGFDTANVTNMSGMFNACTNLAYVDLSNFDMTNCTYKSMIFSGCYALEKAKLSASFAESGAIFNVPDIVYWYSPDGARYNSDSNPKMSAAGTYYAEGNHQVYVNHGDVSEGYYGIAKAWDAANEAGTATVTLLTDAETDATLNVSAGKNITLDLNGYMLKLKLAEGEKGSVIEVNGTFTLTDGYEGEDRKHEVLNVVSEEAGDTVSITGGVITGGNAKWGGGVNVKDGTFNMNGGTISGNSADFGGGGVYVFSGRDDSKFIMNGGTISGNSADFGGGVFVAEGTFEISRAVKITGNKSGDAENNVELRSGLLITVAGALLSGAQIGVTLPDGYAGAFTQGYGTYNRGISPSTYFISDDESKMVALDGGEVLITKPAATVEVNGVPAEYVSITEAWAAANEAGTATITMLADAETADTLTVSSGKDITLDLNGHKLALKEGKSGVVILVSQAAFTLTDSDTASVHKYNIDGDGKWVFSDDGEHTLYGGVITGGNETAGTGAGGVRVNGGTFKMTGGAISGNFTKGPYGGGVYISGGTFEMTGGIIAGNVDKDEREMYGAKFGGGGVMVYNTGVFKMSGTAKICNNTAGNNGGGVYVLGGTFEMTGGAIEGNSATSGGGVYVADEYYNGNFECAAKVTLSGGTISDNTATKNGGGVYVACGINGKTVLDGGKICGNTASEYGGGIYLTTVSGEENARVLEIKSGEISGNEVTKNGSYGGGGICIDDGCKVLMTGGKITDNTTYAVSGDPNEHYGIGGGVLINNGTFEMSGGEISGNTSIVGGGVAVSGIVTAESAVMKLSGGVVSGNTGSGGILVLSDQLLELSGNPVVKSNVQSNGVVADVLPYGNVKVAGALTEGASVGAYIITLDSPVIKDYGTYNTEPAKTYFVSNRSKYCFSLNGVDLELKAHDYSGGFTVDKAATCTESGSKSKHCSRCDSKTEVTEIPAGHSLTHHGAVEATADKAGNTEYWSCSGCDKYFSDEGGATEITDKASVEISKLAVKTSESGKSYVWICWLLFPLALAAGGVTLGIWLRKKR